jgi:cytochrome c peroxidase
LILFGPNGGGQPRTIQLPARGSGLAVKGGTAFVTTDEPSGRVLVISLQTGRIREQWAVGHTPTAPTLAPDGRALYVANRFDHQVAIVDLPAGEIRKVDVVREPVALALSRDGGRVFVANHLPQVKPFLDDENPFISAEVSVIDARAGRLLAHVELPNGSQGLRGIAISRDDRFVLVTHIASNYTRPTLRVADGGMNRNALSVLDAHSLQWLGTAILDDPKLGAANPWALGFSEDGERLLVTHAGTDELSLIDFPKLIQRLATRREAFDPFSAEALTMMSGIRDRVALPIRGPRALLVQGPRAFVPGYFSDDLVSVDCARRTSRVISLGARTSPSAARLGEGYFNDATACLEHWQSCASCHPDGRSDSLYWDLLNDGVGNTKNTKSLLMSALTPPVMWRGVRADSSMAVRSGIRHIQFSEARPEQAEAIEQYLLQMRATASPYLNAKVLETPKTEDASCAKCHVPGVARGTLTEAARRGKAIFHGAGQCGQCHPHPTFTSMETVDPGLGSGVPYDVPSLIEVWRTAPYLHSGDALTLRETITDHNFLQKRGRTKQLSERELNDLLVYLRSL